MSTTGEIKNLYSDKDRTRVLLPRTKTKAVSDENGISLDVLLEGKAPAGDYATQSFVLDKMAELQITIEDIDDICGNTIEVQNYYIGDSEPNSSVGNDGDLYFVRG